MNILLSVDRTTDVASPTDATLQGWVSYTLTQTASLPEPTPELSIRITAVSYTHLTLPTTPYV